jgi:hypothetical protein
VDEDAELGRAEPIRARAPGEIGERGHALRRS